MKEPDVPEIRSAQEGSNDFELIDSSQEAGTATLDDLEPDEVPEIVQELWDAFNTLRHLQDRFENLKDQEWREQRLYVEVVEIGECDLSPDESGRVWLYGVRSLVRKIGKAEDALKEVQKRASDEVGVGIDENGDVHGEQLFEDEFGDDDPARLPAVDPERRRYCTRWSAEVPQVDFSFPGKPIVDDWDCHSFEFGETAFERGVDAIGGDLGQLEAWKAQMEALRLSVESEREAYLAAEEEREAIATS